MQLIPDGYTEFQRIGDDFAFHFRPMLRPERLELLGIANQYADTSTQASIFSSAIAHHIIAWSVPQPPSEPALVALRSRDGSLWMRIVHLVVAVRREQEQESDARSLHRSVILRSLYPHLDQPGVCDYCRGHWFDPLRNLTAKIEGGRRPQELPVLCETPGLVCPLSHYSSPRRTSERHLKALQFDQQCREASVWPDDPIVKRNAEIIQRAERKLRRHRRHQ